MSMHGFHQPSETGWETKNEHKNPMAINAEDGWNQTNSSKYFTFLFASQMLLSYFLRNIRILQG